MAEPKRPSLRVGEVAQRWGCSTTYVRSFDAVLQPEITALGRLYDVERVAAFEKAREQRRKAREQEARSTAPTTPHKGFES